jgi:exosortase N
MILFATQRVIATDTFKAFEKIENCVVADYKITCFVPGILKLENNTSLVYVKYLRGFYDTDHNPAICWKGSGYELSETKMDAAGEVPVYTSMLVNGTETLYTAWWYSNNVSHTVSQLEWRWAMLQGKGPYAIINVTTNNKNELMQVIKRIKEERLLDPLFKK